MHLHRSIAILGTAALWLSGCAMSDDNLARVLTAPDKYSAYNCSDLAVRAKELERREYDLQALMAQAGPGAGGQFVNAVAYRPDYLSVHGEMLELRRTAAEKRCDLAIGGDNAAAVTRSSVPPPPAAQRR